VITLLISEKVEENLKGGCQPHSEKKQPSR